MIQFIPLGIYDLHGPFTGPEPLLIDPEFPADIRDRAVARVLLAVADLG
jgi:hypothetical protein